MNRVSRESTMDAPLRPPGTHSRGQLEHTHTHILTDPYTSIHTLTHTDRCRHIHTNLHLMQDHSNLHERLGL